MGCKEGGGEWEDEARRAVQAKGKAPGIGRGMKEGSGEVWRMRKKGWGM